MKPNKPLVQPTRVMPKRNSARQTNVDEPIRKKRKAKSGDDVLTGEKRKSKVIDASARTESDIRTVNCGSPDANCSICLCSIENRSFTDSCSHTFCFKCLLEWSRVRAVCPLCKKSFTAIVHDYQSYDDYQVYKLPRYEDADQVRLGVSMITAPPIAFVHPVGFWISPDNYASRLHHAEQMIAMRRRVYTEELQLQGTWSATGQIIRPGYISPTLFATNPQTIERLRPWILRDLHVIISRFEVPFVCSLIMDLLQQFHITSEDFYGRLFPHVGLSTRLFLQELDSFSRSPYDMATYDELAVYNSSSAVTVRQTSTHVENISSSSDDSDVEITQSDTQPTFSSVHQVNGLFAALRGRVWSALHGGWNSPVPGPSGYSLTLQRQDDSIANVSILEDFSGESNSAVDGSMTVLSDDGSDIVVVDSNHRHSPITLLSSEDDDEVTVISSHVVHLPRSREFRKKKRRDTNCEIVHDSNNVPNRTSNSVDENASVPTTSQSHQLVSLNEMKETQDQHMTKYSHESNFHIPVSETSGVSARTSLSDSEQLEVLGCETLKTSVSRLARAKRNRCDDNDEDKKLPACKKHVSGHKSSKRKLTNVILTACELNAADVKLETFNEKGCVVEETSFTSASPCNNALDEVLGEQCDLSSREENQEDDRNTTLLTSSVIMNSLSTAVDGSLHSHQTSSQNSPIDERCLSSAVSGNVTSPLEEGRDTLNSCNDSSLILEYESDVSTENNTDENQSKTDLRCSKKMSWCDTLESAEFASHIEQDNPNKSSAFLDKCDTGVELTTKEVEYYPSPQSNVVNEHVVVEDSDDDDCISIKADVESSDSEIEWLPDVLSETRVRRQHCISVSSDELSCVDVVELSNNNVDTRVVSMLDVDDKWLQQTDVSDEKPSSSGVCCPTNSSLNLQENCTDSVSLSVQETIIAESSIPSVQESSDSLFNTQECDVSDETCCGSYHNKLLNCDSENVDCEFQFDCVNNISTENNLDN